MSIFTQRHSVISEKEVKIKNFKQKEDGHIPASSRAKGELFFFPTVHGDVLIPHHHILIFWDKKGQKGT